jgi:hypothetical protein
MESTDAHSGSGAQVPGSVRRFLGATFRGRWSEDGTTFSGGWRPDKGREGPGNLPYDIRGRRASDVS